MWRARTGFYDKLVDDLKPGYMNVIQTSPETTSPTAVRHSLRMSARSGGI